MTLTARQWTHREYLKQRIQDCQKEIEEAEKAISDLDAKETPAKAAQESAKPKPAARKASGR